MLDSFKLISTYQVQIEISLKRCSTKLVKSEHNCWEKFGCFRLVHFYNYIRVYIILLHETAAACSKA